MKRVLLMFAAIAAVSSFVMCTSQKEIHIIAHRGYWNCKEGQMAKNSIASLKAAQKYGFWGTEFDINMTKDSVLLVFHDGSIVIDGDTLAIDQNNYEIFKEYRLINGEPIPTLQDYLKQAKESPNTKLIFEIKEHSTPELERTCADRSIEVLKEYGYFDPEKTIFISFSIDVCKYLVEKAEGFMIQYLDSDITPNVLAGYGIKGVDTHHSVIKGNAEWVKSALEHNMAINTWTVDKEEDMRAVIEAGAQEITTNNPEITRALLKELGIRE